MAAGPLISVIIPTRHRNEDLKRCLEALQPENLEMDPSSAAPGNRTVKRRDFLYEVVVTDDGTDSTAETMLRKVFPWVQWVRGPRRGPAANRNFGANHACGEWLLFLDDDCVPLAGWLEAYAQATVTFAEYNVLEGRTGAPGPRLRGDHESPLNPTGGLLWSCNFGIKRQLFLDLGGFDETFLFSLEDMDLHTRLEKCGQLIKFLPDAYVEHAWRPRRGVQYCLSMTHSIECFTAKHPEKQLMFNKTYGVRRMIKILLVEFPRNLWRYRDLGSVRVLYLDLLTTIHFTLNRIRLRITKIR